MMMTSIVLGVAGGRDFSNYLLLSKELNQLKHKYNIKRIISGGAKGADSLAERYAKENQIEITILKPDWNQFGIKAGKLRNKDIVDLSDLVITFWDGRSPGTNDTIKRSKKGKKLIKIVYYNQYIHNIKTVTTKPKKG
jgi:hypothetical protein